MDNETKSAAIGENYTLTAIVSDDNGNIIESGELQFIIGTAAIQAQYDNLTYKAYYTVVKGETQISAIINDTGLKQLNTKTGVIIGKLSADLKLTVNNITVGENATITINTDAKATGNVTININGEEYNATIKNGAATLTVPNLETGNYTVTVSYSGDDNYAPQQKTSNFTVTKVSNYDLNIKVTKEDANNGIITINLPKDATGNVTVTVNGKEYNASVVNGQAILNTDNLRIGANDIAVSYSGDEKYNPSNKSFVYDGGKKESYVKIIVDDINVGQDAIIKIAVPADATGNIIITVNGKDYLLIANNGIDTVKISGLSKGQYNVLVEYTGDSNYLNSINTTTFNVIGGEIKESIIAITVGENGLITGVLRDINGNRIPDAVITITSNGIKTNIATNNKGEFTIQTDKNNEYLFIFEGNDELSSSIAVITVNDIPTPTIRKNTYIEVDPNFTRVATDYDAGERGAMFYAVLKDSAGNVLANKTVQIGVNGAIYNVTTDEQGRAGLMVNLISANTYTYALSFQGDDEYNASPLASSRLIVTKKTLKITASNKSFKKSAKKSISITLTPSKNPFDGKKYLKSGKKVTLKVNGKTYSAKINAKGVAKFTIKLTKKGKFTAKIKYAGDKTYKAVTKSIKITIK